MKYAVSLHSACSMKQVICHMYFQVAVELLHTYQDLKALGHPDYQCLKEHFRSTLEDAALVDEVSNFSYTD